MKHVVRVIVETLINHFIPYRKLTLLNNIKLDDIIVDITNNGYIKLETDKYTIMVLDENNAISTEKSKFSKVMSTVKDSPLMLIMSSEVLEKRRNIVDDIENMKRTSVHKINVYRYENFIFNIPAHCEVPHHFIVSPEEAKKICEAEFINKLDLPKILSSDSPVVWLGAEPGDYVGVEMQSLTAGTTYRLFLVI